MTDRSLYFVDISSNNFGDGSTFDLDAYWNDGHRWLFRKVSEGTGYHWTEGDAIVDAWHAKGGHVGHYHWLRPEFDPVAQADYFLSLLVGHVKPGDKLMGDDETSYNYTTHQPVPDGTDAQLAARIEAFNARVESKMPHNELLIYTGNWYVDQHPATIAAIKKHRVILSQYDGDAAPVVNPNEFDVAAKQFTDRATVAGLKKTTDYNRWVGSPAVHKPKPAPTPAPVPAPATQSGDVIDMATEAQVKQWMREVLDEGIVGPAGGHRRPLWWYAAHPFQTRRYEAQAKKPAKKAKKK